MTRKSYRLVMINERSCSNHVLGPRSCIIIDLVSLQLFSGVGGWGVEGRRVMRVATSVVNTNSG